MIDWNYILNQVATVAFDIIYFGYRFGVGVEFPIDKTWSMQTGLQLLNRSYSIDEAVTALGITETGKQIYMGTCK